MKAQLLTSIAPLEAGRHPLDWTEMPEPEPAEGEILLRVSTCGVCRTELDEIEGRALPPRLPVIPGHQVVGRVETCGPLARRFKPGERVGAAWIFSACGECVYCLRGEENLCPEFRATGRDANGGYAGFMVIPEAFAFPIPEEFTDTQAAPLLCAGAIGYRSLRLAGLETGMRLGLAGFGSSAHLALKMAKRRWPGIQVYVFTRSPAERDFARELGAAWTGDFGDRPPKKLDRVIDTTPAWKPVVSSLACLAPGGRLVINAIRKEGGDQQELLKLEYPAHLWMEKEIKSVANVTRADVSEFLALAAEMGIQPEVQEYALQDANQALLDLRMGRIRGAKVLRVE